MIVAQPINRAEVVVAGGTDAVSSLAPSAC